MNCSIFRFTLNMHNHRSQASVSAFRGDTAIRLYITITDGGTPYYINDGCTAILCGTKADGNKLYNRCVIENNSVIRYDFTEQTTSCIGVANCEITLYDTDGDVITSPKFVIVVDEREVSYEQIVESITEKEALSALFVEEAKRVESETAREEAETKRDSAETARKNSEDERVVNEKARDSAETEREEAEKARAQAEAERSHVIEEMSHKVDNMMTSYSFDPVSTLALRHDVPATAMPYAVLDSIGGYTKKCTNLLVMTPGQHWGEGEQNEGSVERFNVWVDEDGYLTIDSAGVDTGISCTLALPAELFKNIPSGSTVSTYVRYVSGSANGGYAMGDNPDISFPTFFMTGVAMTPGATYTETTTFSNAHSPTMQVVGVFDHLKLAITVAAGSTAVDDPVYYEGLKSAKVKSVKSYGKNLVTNDMQDIKNWDTTANSTYAIFSLPEIASNGYYTLSAKKNPDLSWGGAVFKVEISKDGGATWSYPDGMGDYFFTSSMDKSPLTFSLEKGHLVRFLLFPKTQSCVDKLINVQFEKGKTATEYSPYVGLIDTYTVPDEVQALDGYGANDTYIDFASKAFVNGETSTDISEHITDTVYLKVEAGGYLVAENDDGIEAPITMTYQRTST